jgi:uncharacterized Zn finger protein (UPF0148 family)
MKTATYTGLDGKKFTVEYDPLAPCILCGLPVVEASMGGTGVCPWCDTGHDRQGKPLDWKPRVSTDAERAMGKGEVIMELRHKATPEEYEAARRWYAEDDLARREGEWPREAGRATTGG